MSHQMLFLVVPYTIDTQGTCPFLFNIVWGSTFFKYSQIRVDSWERTDTLLPHFKWYRETIKFLSIYICKLTRFPDPPNLSYWCCTIKNDILEFYWEMDCPYCQSHKVVKNGHRQGKQSYLCRDCGRQFGNFLNYHNHSSLCNAKLLILPSLIAQTI